MKHEMVKGVESRIKTNIENTNHLITRHENECQRGEGFMYLGNFFKLEGFFNYTHCIQVYLKVLLRRSE